MNKSLYTSTKDISFPDAVYPDSVRNITQYRSPLEQGYDVNNIAALARVEDQKVNNFTLGYITQPDKLSNFISISELTQKKEVITTRLEFNRGPDSISTFLYIYKDENTTQAINELAVGVRQQTFNTFDNNYYFELEFINDYYLRVKHNDGKIDFYLTWNEDTNSLGFVRDTLPTSEQDVIERSNYFRYNIDGDTLFLYKINTQNELYLLTGNNNNNVFTVGMKKNEDEQLTVTGSNTIYIDNNFDLIQQTQNNDFVGYKSGLVNKLTIDTDKSLFDGDGQYVFHVEYNDQEIASNRVKMNFFTLDTNRSEYGYIKRGTNMIESLNRIPSLNQRNYTTFDTGNSEEGGHDKMSLIYNFYDKDIFVPSGLITVFNAPETIYPFEKLNINDSTFVKNGAFAGPGPEISDKIYIKQNQPTQYKNGRYLCTWLSASDIDDSGVWVDRYYYPDAVEKREDLRDIPKFVSSFTDTIDTTIAASSAGRLDINKKKFFDKRSDAVITPNCTIKYERIGTSDIQNIVQSSTPILSGFSNKITFRPLRRISSLERPYLGNVVENFVEEFNANTLSFDGTFYTKLNAYKQINETKEFTISFDAYIDPEKQYGFQLFGNNTNKGFGLFQDMTVTPFIHIASGKTLQILNTEYVPLNEIKFNTNIKDVFKRSALQNFIVSCEGGEVYRVDPKGNKLKLEVQGLAGYINSCMTDDYIYFLLINNVVRRLSLNTFDVEQVGYSEFEEYKGLVDWYENIFVHKNEVYLVPGCDKKMVWEDEDTVFYTVKAAGSLPGHYVVKHNIRKGPVSFLRSDCEITDMEIEFNNVSNEIVIAIDNKLHRYRTTGQEISVIDYDDNSLWGDIEGTDEEKEALLNEQAYLNGGKILAVDTINEYIEGGDNIKRIVVLLSNKDGVVTLDQPSELVQRIEGVNVDNFTYVRLTNYNNINRLYDSKTLDFRLTLQNTYNSEDISSTSISYDINRIDAGFHTFTYTFDGVAGTATLYVDGLLYESLDFIPGKYNLHDIFNDELYVGTSGFVNGTDLSTYLKQPGYYVINDITFKNLYIYNRAASLSLIYALNLLESEINELVLSIPHGQRNNKSTIDRFYKLGRHGSSNKIDVVVNNFSITDEDIIEQIKLNILNDASEILPSGVSINDIKFLQ